MKHDYITLVMRLPTDPEQRREVISKLPMGGEFHGAQITAMSMEDEMTLLECITNDDDFPSEIEDRSREERDRLHRQAEEEVTLTF